MLVAFRILVNNGNTTGITKRASHILRHRRVARMKSRVSTLYGTSPPFYPGARYLTNIWTPLCKVNRHDLDVYDALAGFAR